MGLEILWMTQNQKKIIICNISLNLFPGDGKPQSIYLDSNVLSHRIRSLTPKSTYDITIRAVYSNSEGPESFLSQFTGTSKVDQLVMICYYMYIAWSHGVVASLFCLSDLEVMYFGLSLPVTVNYSMCHYSCYHLVRIPVAYFTYSPLANNRFLVSSQHS